MSIIGIAFIIVAIVLLIFLYKVLADTYNLPFPEIRPKIVT